VFTGAALGSPSSASVIIADNDGPTVAFASASPSVNENGIAANVVVVLDAPPYRS